VTKAPTNILIKIIPWMIQLSILSTRYLTWTKILYLLVLLWVKISTVCCRCSKAEAFTLFWGHRLLVPYPECPLSPNVYHIKLSTYFSDGSWTVWSLSKDPRLRTPAIKNFLFLRKRELAFN